MNLGCTREVYTQDADCCSGEKLSHELTIGTDDGGGGPFLVMKTGRWAFENEAEIDLLARRLKDHIRRSLEIHNEDEAREKKEKEGGRE
jgi:hypothetical protein